MLYLGSTFRDCSFMIIVAVILKELTKLLAGRFQLLCLESCFDHIQGIGDQASKATCYACTDKVPEDRVLLLPGAKVGLKIFVDTNHCRREWDVHAYSDGIRPVKCFHTLFFYYILHALNCRKMGA